MPGTSAWDTAFDHAYTVVADLQPYVDLARRGFAVPSGQREHPGGVSVRYLPFSTTANQRFGRFFQYLEFVKISDVGQFRAAENRGRQSKGLSLRSEERITAPGFSLIGRALKDRLPELQREFAAYKPEFEHVNYRWQTEHAADAPGWSYLKFREDALPLGELWVTEYDPDPVEVNRHRPVIEPSPNTCHQIAGCIWDFGADSGALLTRAQRLCGGELRGGELELRGGFTIWCGGAAASGLGLLWHRGPFRAMVLGCASLATFKRLASPDAVVKWNGQEAAVLTPFASGWAIVVIERPASAAH